MKQLILSLIIILSVNVFSQISDFRIFSFLEPISNNIPESALVEGAENELIMFWTDSTNLHMTSSMDGGISWANGFRTLYSNVNLSDSLSDLNALKINNGRILVTFKHKLHYIIFSDDNGVTWSEPVHLVTNVNVVRQRMVKESSLIQTSDSKIWFVYNRLNMINSIRSIDGITWTDFDTLVILEEGTPHFSTVNSHWDNSLLLFYQNYTDSTSTLEYRSSSDKGSNWSEPTILFNDGNLRSRPRISADLSGSLILTFCQIDPTPFDKYYQNVIYWSNLLNGNSEWEPPVYVTEFTGFNGWQNLALVDGKIYISFTSDRNGEGYVLNYGIVGESQDDLAPPKIFETDLYYQNNEPNINVYFTAKVYDDEIAEVLFHCVEKDSLEKTSELFDDGMHNDGVAEDYIFGSELLGLDNKFEYSIYYSAADINNNIYETPSEEISSPFTPVGGSEFALDNNNLWVPINDRGVIGDVEAVRPDGSVSRRVGFEESYVMYGGGFALSGYTDGHLWSNGVMESNRINDYLHGNVTEIESANMIHVVRSSHPDFYQSWIDWKDAVKQGAEFYDGDGNGIYEPIDKNGNGKWDENEDKPNVIGDITAFTVYNDGVVPFERTFSDVMPQGIEIRQSVFSYATENQPSLSNTVFIKYQIENMATVTDTLKSAYFAVWTDPDIGDALDDLLGVDTLLNAAYCYNDGDDIPDYESNSNYGTNPPACFMPFIQGPPTYIPGETFIDNNDNGRFDMVTDTPLDSAISRMGQYGGVSIKDGAKNNQITSSIQTLSSHPTQSSPRSKEDLRNYMLGMDSEENYIDPCYWGYGEVYEEDCNSVNPRFMYSGDPVMQQGWINTQISDIKQITSTGPFELIKNEPIDIITAYVVGRGDDPLSSITEARKNVQNAIEFYESNFGDTAVVGVQKENTHLPEKYVLHQNYPNPFNPSTTISYSLPTQSQVELKIYDVLGREVATLVNKEQNTGSYQVQFNASNLGSGVYFYQIRAGSFVERKKMILLK